ncbi:F510_1955 family glycosylhydrolase [Paenibacillus sp. 481]|uniref:F510_1955 family glycosylhydrolase n=1 Tax=Paenibacillus sp. 481 TaxID=2835869 RepID=UPI001E4897BB|nr:glycosyl hydrolase [Paenibacillus sp. 481]UHA73220.1 glycosyl hydrolase [Paenibacillus sp. 481]
MGSSNNRKKARDKETQVQSAKPMRLTKWGVIVSLLGIIVLGSIYVYGKNGSTAPTVNLEHVHGIGFSSDGKRILIPAHDGLKAYTAGRWEAKEGAKHDYMGFTTVSDGFYSSGHPAPGSDLKNPFGIVKSTNEGNTLQMLALQGETDFHHMAVGYHSHVIYAVNPEANSKMDAAGLFYSVDQGRTWTKSVMKGLNEQTTAIAAHATEAPIVAVGTPRGVYLSKDYGNSFEKVWSAGETTSLFFNLAGKLFIGGYENQAYLQQLDIDTKQSEKHHIPELGEDAIAYFGQNPVNNKQWAFGTFNKNVYITEDNGLNWTKIADKGKTSSELTR